MYPTICGISMNNKNGNTHFYEICCISLEWVSLLPLINHKEMQVLSQQQMEEVNEYDD